MTVNKMQNQELDLNKYKVNNYKETKINHLSILAHALIFKDYEEIKGIILANDKIISLNQIEEDGLETISYLLDSQKCNLKEKLLYKNKKNGYNHSYKFYNIMRS